MLVYRGNKWFCHGRFALFGPQLQVQIGTFFHTRGQCTLTCHVQKPKGKGTVYIKFLE